MSEWWRDAVCYQVYIRSFADSNGDGVGDLAGIRARMGHIASLGVDAVWITPFYPSPMADHGYDVADYRDVDPLFGTLDEFDAMLAEAHSYGIRVLIDVVPNHTSDQHAWFRAALSSRDDPHRDLYVFRDPKPDGSPPNNWGSVFGGPAWTLHEPTGQYYLHLFAPEQPDLNWRHPDVHADFERTLRFWLDRGVDGFRIDVAHALYKDEAMRDNPPLRLQRGSTAFHSLEQRYTFDQPEVHGVYRAWRTVCEEYDGERTMVGEVFLFEQDKVARYVRPGHLPLAFNFLLMGATWSAERFRECIDATLTAMRDVGATCTWVLSNHDITRHATRFGGGSRGVGRARAAALVQLALPGTCFVYQGDELALEEADVPDDRREDPIFFRTAATIKGRDGCRVPIPWDDTPPACGFSTADPWLPIPDGWCERSVAAQTRDPASSLHLYRAAIAARRELLRSDAFSWLVTAPGVLGFSRGTTACVCNMGDADAHVDLPGEIVLSSDVGVRRDGARILLPAGTACWVRA